MIHKIYSSLNSFKELRFHKGLNILLADKTPTSSEKQTRNSAGKSSFVDIVHILLGGSIKRNSIFRNEVLVKHWFGIEFDLNDKITIVERSGTPRSSIVIKDANFDDWEIKPKIKADDWIVSTDNWREILGNLIFNLPLGDEYNALGNYKPSFRSLYSYFARTHPNGFHTYEKHFVGGGKDQYQIPLSYILGVDWKISQEFAKLRADEKRVSESKKASETEDFLPDIGSTATLRTQFVVKEQRFKELQSNLKNFRILPEYRQYENEANVITSQMSELSDNITLDQRMITDLQLSMQQEQAPKFKRLEELYREANIILPDLITLRYEEAREFHRQIVENRRLYLQGEIEKAQQRIIDNEILSRNLESRYSEIMAILQPYGAIDQRVALEGELAKLASELELLRQQFNNAEAYERRKTELELKRKQLELQLQQNFSEQRTELDLAVLAFEEVAQQLYETGGELIIQPTDNGPEFKVTMRGDKSKGITNMQIFAFDMMLMLICARRNISPRFLIHDSHLFDGVDTRQIHKALQVGQHLADEYDFQYIVTMNSDVIPKGFEEYYIESKLTDATETGGLFGIRFD